MAATPELFKLQLEEHQLAGERWVSTDGSARPEVILLHGGGQTRHSWKRTAARLSADGWGVTALDARGHGDSDWHPRGDYSIDGFVGDLRTYIAMLDRRPVLVGASLGGIIALMTEGENPGSTAALVLVDIVVNAEPAGIARIREFMTAHQDGFGSLEEVADAISAYNPNRPRPQSLDGLRKNVRQREDGRWYWHWDPAFMMSSPNEPQRRTGVQRMRTAAEHVHVPTLLVRGLQSEVVSDEGIADMQRLIPQAQVVQVGAAGHMIAGDDNDVFTGRLEEFLGGLD
jgi:pimeloyl-ACP methyl ester carboxylesterase